MERMDMMYVQKKDNHLFIVSNGSWIPINMEEVYGNEDAKFIFSKSAGGFEVRSEYRGRLIYRKLLLKDVTYMITSLYVDTMNTIDREYQELYTYLVESGYEFRLIKTQNRIPYEIYINMRIDIIFQYTIEVYVNLDELTLKHVGEVREMIETCDHSTLHDIYDILHDDDGSFMIELNKETLRLFNKDSVEEIREKYDKLR